MHRLWKYLEILNIELILKVRYKVLFQDICHTLFELMHYAHALIGE